MRASGDQLAEGGDGDELLDEEFLNLEGEDGLSYYFTVFTLGR